MIHFDTQSRFVHSSILDKPRKSLFSSHKSSTTSLCLCEPYYSLLIWFLYYSDCRNNSCTHLNPVVQRSAVKIKFVKGKMVVKLGALWEEIYLNFWLQNILNYETIIYLKWNDMICGTFWCIKKMYDNYQNVFLCKPDWWFTEQ